VRALKVNLNVADRNVVCAAILTNIYYNGLITLPPEVAHDYKF